MDRKQCVPVIYYFSDCSFFAGCENMLANFLNDNTLNDNYLLRLVYRSNKTYQNGLFKRVNSNLNFSIPVLLLNQIDYRSKFIVLTIFLKSIYLPYKYLTILINTVILYNVFRREKIDILHINNGGYPGAISCYSAVFAARLCGVKRIIYVVNNIAQPYINVARYLDKPIDKLIVKLVSKFVTSSIAAGKVLVDTLNIPELNYLTINNGISSREVSESRNDFKIKYNIPFNKIIFTTIANFEDRKGHKYLLEAINLLNISKQFEILEKVHFLLEGHGPEKASIVDYIEKNKLGKYVQILDHVDDIYNLYNITDIFILPSIGNEDFPNVVLEAMSFGIPVIGTNISGIPEQIDHLESGFVIRPKLATDLISAIIKLTNDKELYTKFSINSLSKFSTKYSKEVSIRAYTSLYQDLLSNN